MRTHLWLAGLATLATISTADAAQDVEVVANSILRTYSDYCDPLFFEQNRSAGAPVDAQLAYSYSRVMLMRYDGRCDRFFNAEVAAATMLPNLLRGVVELQRSVPRTLTELQIGLLGSIRRYDDMAANECGGQPQDASDISHVRAVAEPWLAALGRDDALDFAKGYVGAEAFARLAIGLPAGGSIPTPCSVREVVASTIELAAVNSSLTAPRRSEGNSSSLVFPEPTYEQADPDGNGYGEDGPDWSDDTPTGNRGAEVSADLPPSIPLADIAAIRPFEGIWAHGPRCGEPAAEVAIGQFEWQGGREVFVGRGVPLIAAADLYCELEELKPGNEATTFTAVCFSEGEPSKIPGSVLFTASNTIELRLGERGEFQRLVRCNR